MAKADPRDTQLFLAGRDLLGMGNVHALELAIGQASVDTTGIRSATKRHELLSRVADSPLSFTAFLDNDDPPEAAVRGVQARTISGGFTLRLWPGRGERSIVSERSTFTTRGYQFGQSDFVKLAGEGTLEGVRNGLSVEDRTITGSTGVGGETARAVDLRSPPFPFVPTNFIVAQGDTRARMTVNNDLIRNHKVVVGDEIALVNLVTNSQVKNLFEVTAVEIGNIGNNGLIDLADADNASNAIFVGGSQQLTSMNTIAGTGTPMFRVVHHAGEPTQHGRGQHGMAVHLPSVVWQDADRLDVRPIYRTLTAQAVHSAWDRSTAAWTIVRPGGPGSTPDRTPRFHWFEFTSQQPAQVAFDWTFRRDDGNALLANNHVLTVLADYVPRA